LPSMPKGGVGHSKEKERIFELEKGFLMGGKEKERRVLQPNGEKKRLHRGGKRQRRSKIVIAKPPDRRKFKKKGS